MKGHNTTTRQQAALYDRVTGSVFCDTFQLMLRLGLLEALFPGYFMECRRIPLMDCVFMLPSAFPGYVIITTQWTTVFPVCVCWCCCTNSPVQLDSAAFLLALFYSNSGVMCWNSLAARRKQELLDGTSGFCGSGRRPGGGVSQGLGLSHQIIATCQAPNNPTGSP